MNKRNKTWMCILVLMGCLSAGLPASAASADKQLEKGITAYQNHDNDKALDYFIDVLMDGNNEQVAKANSYINAIHNEMGGIKHPVEVDISFPDQPTQTIIDKGENLANYGTERLNSLADTANQALQDTQDIIGKENKTLTEQIEARQLEGYLQETAQPIQAQQSALLEQSTVMAEEANNGVKTTQQDLQAIANEFSQQAAAATASEKQTILTPVLNGETTTYTPTQTSATTMPLSISKTNASSSELFADLTSPAAIEARNLYTVQKLQSMKEAAVAALSSDPGVHLYMRADGRPDAIDIDDGVLFQGNSFRPEAFSTLNSIYELLALTQDAQYIILPAGSYTDDVTLAGIRQAMALQSYLVKRGISQGKLYYNMGLVDQEVPVQFSNLKGLSIVFDYDAKLPTRLLDNASGEKAPLLSMAIVPACHAIDRSLGEAYAIDFSVLETVDTLDNWMLQIIQHGRDGNYYIVRQLEGFSPVYHQILWNGRKGIIGPELPCGKYTVVLTGTDVKGNKQTLRRRLVVKCEGVASLGSCETGKCTTTDSSATQTTTLNYKAARLWKKPGRVMGGIKQAKVAVQEEAQVQQVADEQATAQSTSTSTYTHTQTTRNIVVDDHSIDTTTTAGGYAPMPTNAGGYLPADSSTNPYDMVYEEEYTTY